MNFWIITIFDQVSLLLLLSQWLECKSLSKIWTSGILHELNLPDLVDENYPTEMSTSISVKFEPFELTETLSHLTIHST